MDKAPCRGDGWVPVAHLTHPVTIGRLVHLSEKRGQKVSALPSFQRGYEIDYNNECESSRRSEDQSGTVNDHRDLSPPPVLQMK